MVELADLAASVVARARPGEEVEAFVSRGRRVSVRAYGGEVEALTSAESAGVGIRVVAGGRQGFASCGTLDADVVAETLAEARDNLAFAEVDPWAGLARPDGVAPVELDLWSPELAVVPTEAKVRMALELEAAVRAGDARITGVRSASYGDSTGEAAVATSTGIATWSQGTSCWLSVSALAADGSGTQTGGGVGVGRHPGELRPDEVAADAVHRATRLLGARPVPSRRTTVVLDPRVSVAVFGIVGSMLSGERVLKRRSPFADRLGQAVASPALTLVDDPTDARSSGADTHDGEGLATRRTVLIEQGVLRGFLHNSASARRAGTASTASAVRGYSSPPGVGCTALAPTPGTVDLEQLCRQVGEGFLVLSVSGLHSGVNRVSGDFSVGAEGLLIRDGQPAEPVREVTIASTVPRMLTDLVAVGGDLEWMPGGHAGASLVVDGVSLSGS